MAKYTFKVEIDGVNVTNAVEAPFTITNGRTSFTDGFVRVSAQMSLFKKAAQTILTTAGKTTESLVAGNSVTISVYDAGEADYIPMLYGVITSTSSDNRVYSLSITDEVYFALAGDLPLYRETVQSTAPEFCSFVLDFGTNRKWDFDYDTNPLTEPNYLIFRFPEYTRTDRASMINQFAQLTYYAMATIRPPSLREISPFNPDTTYVGDVREPDVSTTVVSLTDGDIDEAYSTNRNSSDIFNLIEMNYNSGLSVPDINDDASYYWDQTSADKFGYKQYTVDSYGAFPTYSPNDEAEFFTILSRIAYKFLQYFNTHGWAMVKFGTSADRLGLTNKATIETLYPSKVIDTSAVTAAEFQAKQIIQQVEHVCYPHYWEIRILGANYRFASPPQTWAEVDATLKWEDVPNYLTWNMIMVKDL